MIILNQQYNIGHICTRQQCDNGLGDHVACRWISATGARQNITFAELDLQSNKFARVLDSLGFVYGDILFTLLPKSPEQFFCFLGGLKKQLICGPLFANFGDEALRDRLRDAQAKGIVTRKSFLKKINRILGQLPTLSTVLVIDLEDHQSDRILSYPKLMETAIETFDTPLTSPQTPSVLHYTSGSTGKPKGVVHAHQSVLMQNATTRQILQLKSDDIYWCTADQGWVTGTSYGIIGPWSLGVTQVHFGGSYNGARWLELLADERVSVWYTAPTALRMLMSDLATTPGSSNLTALRAIFSVGEPLNPEVIQWARTTLHKEIYDTWFQTETGAIMIANRPGVAIRPGSMGIVADGVEAAVVSDSGESVAPGQIGFLSLKSGWSSMFLNYLNNDLAYREKFQGNYYFTGDKAMQDADGYFWFKGRDDDIINTGGHLISPFEIESVLLEHKEVAESGVVGVPDSILYEKIIAFVKLNRGFEPDKELEIKLRLWISNRLSTIATPYELIFIDEIPKNKSGKIMRRVLKSRYLGHDCGDITTLET